MSLLRDERIHFGGVVRKGTQSARKQMLCKMNLSVSAVINLSLLQILTVRLGS